MYIQQIYTNCLAHAAYYIESAGEAAVIDPLRDPGPYQRLAAERGATIKYVFETHFHADFVSGHIDLANNTGAQIVFGPDAQPGYKCYIAEDGEMLPLGDVRIEVLHTPGHTIESTCFLLHDAAGRKQAIFTGDTLFVGDVGRPDLLSGNLPKEVLAVMLFDSLQSKIKTLPDDVVVYPGHGAGSACGKNIGKSSYTTIGEQRTTNYALLATNKDEFIQAVTSDQPVIPAYFFKDAVINKSGATAYQSVLEQSLKPLSNEAFTRVMEAGAVVLDTRDPMEFAAGFVKGAINIGLNGDFAVWVGTIIAPDAEIVLVCEPGREGEAIERLARIGYEGVKGFLDGGMKQWFAADLSYDVVLTIDGSECEGLINEEQYELLDVRNRREVARNRMVGSVHIPLNILKDEYAQLGADKKWLIYCAGGYRSMVAASFLKSKGFHFVASVEGGIKEVQRVAPSLVEELVDAD
ncbi:MAG: MBL fold metallo-hydrolase [Flavipsychrobacter sp.]|nr:MBL fold metallo-hydrolase [Flavipsychrobacter sp.]